MPFIKLQLGCLLIIAYIEIAYIRDISNADFRQIAHEVARFTTKNTTAAAIPTD